MASGSQGRKSKGRWETSPNLPYVKFMINNDMMAEITGPAIDFFYQNLRQDSSTFQQKFVQHYLEFHLRLVYTQGGIKIFTPNGQHAPTRLLYNTSLVAQEDFTDRYMLMRWNLDCRYWQPFKIISRDDIQKPGTDDSLQDLTEVPAKFVLQEMHSLFRPYDLDQIVFTPECRKEFLEFLYNQILSKKQDDRISTVLIEYNKEKQLGIKPPQLPNSDIIDNVISELVKKKSDRLPQDVPVEFIRYFYAHIIHTTIRRVSSNPCDAVPAALITNTVLGTYEELEELERVENADPNDAVIQEKKKSMNTFKWNNLRKIREQIQIAKQHGVQAKIQRMKKREKEKDQKDKSKDREKQNKQDNQDGNSGIEEKKSNNDQQQKEEEQTISGQKSKEEFHIEDKKDAETTKRHEQEIAKYYLKTISVRMGIFVPLCVKSLDSTLPDVALALAPTKHAARALGLIRNIGNEEDEDEDQFEDDNKEEEEEDHLNEQNNKEKIKLDESEDKQNKTITDEQQQQLIEISDQKDSEQSSQQQTEQQQSSQQQTEQQQSSQQQTEQQQSQMVSSNSQPSLSSSSTTQEDQSLLWGQHKILLLQQLLLNTHHALTVHLMLL
ncbi:MAG: hypothetical protein EZS28_004748 [Streblomastix strix]|uniref:Uncharacterized protein n=1 Tax=Streblomastix strix TaxID=222440 RepID=A0A5J4WXC3_9EUKA|nr:MAG: hypothetical protein EZS28_004748 [Streblomastix strix]